MLRNRAYQLMLDVDVVINLVAESAVLSSSKPQEMYETNAFSAQSFIKPPSRPELVNFFTSTAGALLESGRGPKTNWCSQPHLATDVQSFCRNSHEFNSTTIKFKTYIFRLSNVLGNYMSAKKFDPKLTKTQEWQGWWSDHWETAISNQRLYLCRWFDLGI